MQGGKQLIKTGPVPIKNTLEDLQRKFDLAEEIIRECKGNLIKITQS